MVEKTNGELKHKQVFTTGEAAGLCRVSQQTIIRCFDKGRLGGFRVPGSRFRRIPRDALVRFMRENEIPTHALTGEKPHRVLVVDDDRAINEMLSDTLGRRDDLEIQTAASGYEAGLLSRSFQPHLMVLDYMLPDINGKKVIESIRQDPQLRPMKIILVSGMVNQDQVDGLIRRGADAFVKKPFDVQKLLKRIEMMLGQ